LTSSRACMTYYPPQCRQRCVVERRLDALPQQNGCVPHCRRRRHGCEGKGWSCSRSWSHVGFCGTAAKRSTCTQRHSAHSASQRAPTCSQSAALLPGSVTSAFSSRHGSAGPRGEQYSTALRAVQCASAPRGRTSCGGRLSARCGGGGGRTPRRASALQRPPRSTNWAVTSWPPRARVTLASHLPGSG